MSSDSGAKKLFVLAVSGSHVSRHRIKPRYVERTCAKHERQGIQCDRITDRKAWRAAIVSLLVGLALLSTLIRIRLTDTVPRVVGAKCTASPIGWLGALTAMLVFGSTTLLSKLSTYRDVNPVTRGGLYATFNALGSAVLNLSVCWVMRQSGLLHNAAPAGGLAYGVLGASIISIVLTCCFFGCQRAGAACTVAVLASTGMCTSFLWGVLAFHEPLRSVPLAALAIVVLVTGAFLCSMANTSLPLRWGASGSSKKDVQASDGLLAKSLVTGLCFAFAGGLMDGTLMVPFKLFCRSFASATQSLTFQYMEAFGFGQLFCFAIMLLVQLAVWKRQQTSLRGFGAAVRVCAVPGIITGIAWAIANVGSVHASEYLGVALGFPLTQTNIMLHAVVGILIFGEMPHPAQRRIAALAMIIIILGAMLLARAGSI